MLYEKQAGFQTGDSTVNQLIIFLTRYSKLWSRHEIGRRPITWKSSRKMLGLENAVDAISDAEKPISQRISERTI
jgi:hypothetical protein